MKQRLLQGGLIFLLCAGLVFLFGCDKKALAVVTTSPQQIEVISLQDTGSERVLVIKLADGTRCATYRTLDGCGITCDWK